MTYYVDGPASLATMRTLTGLVPHTCLNAAWRAYSANGAHSAQTYDTAHDAMLASGPLLPGLPPDVGYPVWFTDAGTAGDVAIYSGNGNCVGIWFTKTAEMSLSTRAQAVGGTYLGYTERFLPHNIITNKVIPTLKKEDDDMLMLEVKAGNYTHLVALAPGVFRHFLPTDPYQYIMQLSRINDDWQTVPAAYLPALLRTYGCDTTCYQLSADDSTFSVLDPNTGKFAPGNMWSAIEAYSPKNVAPA